MGIIEQMRWNSGQCSIVMLRHLEGFSSLRCLPGCVRRGEPGLQSPCQYSPSWIVSGIWLALAVLLSLVPWTSFSSPRPSRSSRLARSPICSPQKQLLSPSDLLISRNKAMVSPVPWSNAKDSYLILPLFPELVKASCLCHLHALE